MENLSTSNTNSDTIRYLLYCTSGFIETLEEILDGQLFETCIYLVKTGTQLELTIYIKFRQRRTDILLANLIVALGFSSRDCNKHPRGGGIVEKILT